MIIRLPEGGLKAGKNGNIKVIWRFLERLGKRAVITGDGKGIEVFGNNGPEALSEAEKLTLVKEVGEEVRFE